MNKLPNILNFIINHPLSRRHKVKALFKFFKWQFTQSLYPRLVEQRFIGKTKLWARKGMEAATANIYTGLHEFNEMAFLLHFLRQEDTFVDVGANIGAYSILASGVAGARAISIEPVPATFRMLQKNIALNGIEDKVLVLNMGIGSANGALFFTADKDSANHVILNIDKEGEGIIKVAVSSLDSILQNEQCPQLIKIDVEGFEQEVINGAANVLANEKLKAIIIELIGEGKRYGFDEENVHNQLLEYGFLTYEYFPFERKLSENKTQISNNALYVRNINFVKDRLVNAEPIHVFSEKI